MSAPRRPLTGPEDPRHGTPNAYNRHGCRCARCTEANAEKARRQYRAKEARPRPFRSEEERSQQARERRSQWSRTPAGKQAMRTSNQRRRARRILRDCGCVTADAIRVVWAMDGQACAYCGAGGEHLDHAVSLAAGGWNCVSNLRIACAGCNHTKNARPLAYLFERLAASGVDIRPGATNSGLPCPSAAARMAARMLPAGSA